MRGRSGDDASIFAQAAWRRAMKRRIELMEARLRAEDLAARTAILVSQSLGRCWEGRELSRTHRRSPLLKRVPVRDVDDASTARACTATVPDLDRRSA
ncbi:MAG TPA: hypothetical protein VGJ13_17725 [Pseudonocardiaceae bacterium]